MIVHIEAPAHPSFESAETYYQTPLKERYSPFEFIKKIQVHISEEHGVSTVKLTAHLERGEPAFAKGSDAKEQKAFKEAMNKVDKLIRKYKSKHYHGI